jgi:hypothetical protein
MMAATKVGDEADFEVLVMRTARTVMVTLV